MARFLITSALVAIFVAGASISSAMSEESLVTLSAPADGAKLAAGQPLKAEYEVKVGTKAHHVHLFVDGEEVGTAHKLKGALEYGPLKAGAHDVCAVPVNKAHTPMGAQACASVTAQ